MLAAPATAGAAGGLKYVTSKPKDLPAGTIKKATAKCPDSAHVVGGGLTIGGANTATGIHSSYPIDGRDRNKIPDDGWRGVVNSRSAGHKTFRVSAICSRRGRLVYTRTTTNIPTPGHIDVAAFCPSGTPVAGGGVQLSGGGSSDVIAGSQPVDSDLDMVTDDGWSGVANTTVDGAVELTAHAICARSGDYDYVSADGTVPGFQQGSAAVDCPGGTRITGGGGSSATATTSTELAGTFPYFNGASSPGHGWRTYVNNLAGVPLDITAFAVCRS